jgi:3-methyladenine DNA glycosylase/8-oxoguanine DNA glycosylase
LREIPGIGPFYSALIVIRATGFADVLPVGEPKFRTLAERLYHLRAPVSDTELAALAEAWKPFRTWAAVLIRAAARRILDDEPPQSSTKPGGRRRRMEDTVAGTVAPHRAETVRS